MGTLQPDETNEAEFSLLTHTQTKELYAMPSSLSPLAKSL